MDMKFSEKMLDHFNDPRNVGTLDESSPRVGVGVVTSSICGDVTKLSIEVDGDGRIVQAKFKTFGCGAAIASASLATEWLRGKTVEEALGIKDLQIAKELELPPIKVHCSVMTEDAVAAAVEDWRKKNAT